MLLAVLLANAILCGPFDSLNKGLHKLGEFGQKVGQEAKKATETVIDTSKNVGQQIGEAAKNVGGGVVDGTKNAGQLIGENAKKFGQAVAETTKQAAGSVGQFGKDALDSTKNAEKKAEDVVQHAAQDGVANMKKGLDILKDFKKLMGLFGFSKKPEPSNNPSEIPPTNPTLPAGPALPTPAPSPEPANNNSGSGTATTSTTPAIPSTTFLPTVIPIPNFRPPIPHGQESRIPGATTATEPSTSSNLNPRPSWKPSSPGQGIFSSSTSTSSSKPTMNPFGSRVDGQRGQFYVGSGLEEIIAKLANEKVRSELIDGFFGVTPKVHLGQKCLDAIQEIKSLVLLVTQHMAARQVAADSNIGNSADLIGSLSLFVKADAVVSKLRQDKDVIACLSGSMSPLKVFLAKLLLANEEFVEKAKENTEVWIQFANVAFSFQLEMYNSAGQGLASILKAISKTQVASLPDSKAEKIDLWKCFTAVLKTKSHQKTVSDDPEGQLNSWVLAAVESKQACLATADLN